MPIEADRPDEAPRPDVRRGLTAADIEIVDLVARGLTNREAATVLQISAKTVEWKLTRIYRATGVRSRTELAATYARQRERDAKPQGHSPQGEERS
jgi:DNA-binding CsgD family transcriptional regulator